MTNDKICTLTLKGVYLFVSQGIISIFIFPTTTSIGDPLTECGAQVGAMYIHILYVLESVG